MIQGIQTIGMSEIESKAKEEGALIIDLRDMEEFNSGHIQGATVFPYQYINEWQMEFPQNVPVILYCERGNNSLLAARRLRRRGITVYTVVGGWESR